MSKSSTITEHAEELRNPHAGEILQEEFLKPLALSQSALARAIARAASAYQRNRAWKACGDGRH